MIRVMSVIGLVLALVSTGATQELRQVEYAGVKTRVSAFSGKPVPRFESLKYPAVHGRSGPSLNYPIMWRYERTGLPVLVIKETREWVKIRDPQGDEVWMHQRMLGGSTSVMIQGSDMVPLKRDPSDEAKSIAGLEPGLIAELDSCDVKWCRIDVSGRKGWVERVSLWGAPGALSVSM